MSPQLEVAAGLATFKVGLNVGYRYMHLDYDAPSLDAEGAHGWEIGAAVRKEF